MATKKRLVKPKKKFSLKREYLEDWNYIKTSRDFIYTIVLVFFIFFFVGFIFPVPQDLAEKLIELLKNLVAETEGLGLTGLIWYIFNNNLQSSFFGLIFGVALGIFPFLSAIFNGYVVGFVSALAVSFEGPFALLKLFPHGIFELPAVFIALGLGLKLGSFVLQKDKRKYLVKNFVQSLRVFIFVVLPLLFIAAIIEGLLIYMLG